MSTKKITLNELRSIVKQIIKEESENNNITTKSGKIVRINATEDEINQGDILLNKHNSSRTTNEYGYYVIGVTGKYKVYYTFWRFNPKARVNTLYYLGNLSENYLKSIEKAISKSNTLKVFIEDESTLSSLKGAPKDMINFGKYRGKTLGEVFLEDPQYIVWLAKEYRGNNNQFAKIAQDLSDGFFNNLADENRLVDKKEYVDESKGPINATFIITKIEEKTFEGWGQYDKPRKVFYIRGENDKHRFAFYVDYNNYKDVLSLDSIGKELTVRGSIKEKKELVGKKYNFLNRVTILK